MSLRPLLPTLLIAASVVVACAGPGDRPGDGPAAQAVLSPTAGSTVRGLILFEAVDGGVRITAEVQGLEPNGVHGFHIHDRGDCSAPDGTSAGGHFDPHAAPHGAPGGDAGLRHVGDLGNLVADADGRARYERVDALIELRGNDAILGRGVIVHAQADDLTTQPTGAAGPRLACGVIGRVR